VTARPWRRTKIGDGLWQVYGIGDLRWTIFGTVEKVYGGWFAVTASGDERSCEQLKEGCQWVADQHSGKPS
jgi:hypothetical protein